MITLPLKKKKIVELKRAEKSSHRKKQKEEVK